MVCSSENNCCTNFLEHAMWHSRLYMVNHIPCVIAKMTLVVQRNFFEYVSGQTRGESKAEEILVERGTHRHLESALEMYSTSRSWRL